MLVFLGKRGRKTVKTVKNYGGSLETNLASRWEGVRLPRASGKSPDFPGSSPNFPGSFSATSPEVSQTSPEVPRTSPEVSRTSPEVRPFSGKSDKNFP